MNHQFLADKILNMDIFKKNGLNKENITSKLYKFSVYVFNGIFFSGKTENVKKKERERERECKQ